MDFLVKSISIICVFFSGISLAQDLDPSQLCGERWDTKGKAVIDLDHVADFNVLRSIAAYFCDNTPINIQVWKPVGLLQYELVWQHEMQPTDAIPGKQEFVLPLDQHFPVVGTFRVGFAPSEFGDFPVGMSFFPANVGSVVVSNDNALPTQFTMGTTYDFVELTFPYKFSVALCNDTGSCLLPDISIPTRPLLNETEPGDPGIPNSNFSGVPGEIGPMGIAGPIGSAGLPGIFGDMGIEGDPGLPGDTGPEGPKGPRGDTGDSGPVGRSGLSGAPGLQGLPGPVVDTGDGTIQLTAAPLASQGCDCSGFSDPDLILGMICWALALTLIILIMLIIATKYPYLTS